MQHNNYCHLFYRALVSSLFHCLFVIVRDVLSSSVPQSEYHPARVYSGINDVTTKMPSASSTNKQMESTWYQVDLIKSLLLYRAAPILTRYRIWPLLTSNPPPCHRAVVPTPQVLKLKKLCRINKQPKKKQHALLIPYKGKTRCLCETRMPQQQRSPIKTKISISYILTTPHPQAHMMSP